MLDKIVLDDLVFSLKDVVWAVAFKNGKFNVIPFIFNYDMSEIMDITNGSRYLVTPSTAKSVIVGAVKEKHDGMEVREIVEGVEIEKGTDYSYFKKSNPHLLCSPQRVAEWFASLIMGRNLLLNYAQKCGAYLTDKFQRKQKAKESRLFGVKDNKALKLPYTDLSTQFEFGDVYFAIVNFSHSGKSVVPCVLIEDELGQQEVVKELGFGAKVRLSYFNVELNKRVQLAVSDIYSGVSNCIGVIKGVDIDRKYKILVGENDKNYEEKIKELSERKYDAKALIEISKLYTRALREQSEENQTKLDKYM